MKALTFMIVVCSIISGCVLPTPKLLPPRSEVPSDSTYVITWTSVDDDKLRSYLLQESADPTFGNPEDFSVVRTDTSVMFVHTECVGTPFHYRVKALAADSSRNSSFSSAVKVTVQAVPALQVPSLVDPGTKVASGQRYTVRWSGSPGKVEYILEEADNAAFSEAVRFTVTGTSRGFLHTECQPKTYFYRVSARNACGSTPPSNVESIDVEAEATPRSPSLSNPGSSVESGQPYRVRWSNVGSGVSYVLQEARNSGFSEGLATFALESTTREFVHSVSEATNYFYRVRSRNRCGTESDWSATRSIEVEPLQAPQVSAVSPAMGAFEDEVTLNGSLFERNSQVLFNGQVVSSRFVGSSRLQFTVPCVGEGSYRVQVRNPNGLMSNVVNFTLQPSASIVFWGRRSVSGVVTVRSNNRVIFQGNIARGNQAINVANIIATDVNGRRPHGITARQNNSTVTFRGVSESGLEITFSDPELRVFVQQLCDGDESRISIDGSIPSGVSTPVRITVLFDGQQIFSKEFRGPLSNAAPVRTDIANALNGLRLYKISTRVEGNAVVITEIDRASVVVRQFPSGFFRITIQ